MRRYLKTMLGFAAAVSLGLIAPTCFSQNFKSSDSRSMPKADGKKPSTPSYVVLGYNDLGMHCMNQDFSQLCILPPFNSLHAQVIQIGREEPKIVTSGVEVNYRIPSNTTSYMKTNFWNFAPSLFGVNLPRDVGLTGNGLRGTMKVTPSNDWVATGIPLTPIDDSMTLNP